ncbi:hypothetical protein [Pedobacter nutrimenti]|uniref:3-keto-disaccharide hydrolase domain-containing protein n=1 Tax=Pedobacter nutrimenti TaxID=1241337 RepID=A0A318UDM4_9SPHI|nr:hypothetical protein [Pedobacter nutrimenti]PYF74311.1 hypothetical protein B0O44_104482 [Pedobacter nutrimenti]
MTKTVKALFKHLRSSKNNLFKGSILLLLITGIASPKIILAQNSTQAYRVVNRSMHLDKKSDALHLNEVEGAGIAWIKNKTFTNGTIEFDVKGKDTLQSSFVGIAFNGLNDTTYQCIYFRPFNFLAADPVRKSHAVQYIAMPRHDWPTLRDNFPNQYEQPISTPPNPNEWFHVKIQVSEKQISVYVNGNKDAALTLKPLVNTWGKMIGYWAGNGSGGDWKNLKITSR